MKQHNSCRIKGFSDESVHSIQHVQNLKTNVYSKSENYNKSKSVGNATNGQNNRTTTRRDIKNMT